MFDNTSELAENKLLVLFIVSYLNFSISNNQLTKIVLENDLINYFTLQQYVSELINSQFLTTSESDGNHGIWITDKGKKVLSLFLNRLSEEKVKGLTEYLTKEYSNLKKEFDISANYTLEKNDNYIVQLKALENDVLIIDLKINVDSNKKARELCTKWKENYSSIYNKIINSLIEI